MMTGHNFTRVATVLAGLGMIGAELVGQDKPAIKGRHVAAAERIIGLDFTRSERKLLLPDLIGHRQSYAALRDLHLPNSVVPALQFNPLLPGHVIDTEQRPIVWSPVEATRPVDLDDLAWYSVAQLGALIRNREITSRELTEFFLNRLKRYDAQLLAVVTLTGELALAQADRADREISAGNYRGPLHGIPYGAKDLLAAKGYLTTWGAAPYKEQLLEENAAVIARLEAAGAVLVAKLTLGALAWGDVWFGGMTRNPWNTEQGSSGSSAGPASAVAAGLVPFAIGSETWGSIVSPATRTGVTGLRPTYGRVSRAGAMALSWSMDKLGPICREVEDCAIIFDAIRGPSGAADADPSVVDLPFNYHHQVDLSALRIGVYQSAFEHDYSNQANDEAVLEILRELGAELIPMELPDYPVSDISFVLSAEAAAAFDDLTLSGRDDLLVRQIEKAWPNVFRAARFIPAVEYIQANRARRQLMEKMAVVMDGIDVYLSPSFGGNNLLLTNLTGHPCVVLPNGFNEEGAPTSITFMGRLYDEATLLAVARAYQQATRWHKQHPPAFE